MDVYCSVSRVPIQLIMSLILSPYVCGNLFEEVSSCPSDEVKWRERAQKKECKEPIPDFMCAAIENQPGRFGEICTVVGLTGKGKNNEENSFYLRHTSFLNFIVNIRYHRVLRDRVIFMTS